MSIAALAMGLLNSTVPVATNAMIGRPYHLQQSSPGDCVTLCVAGPWGRHRHSGWGGHHFAHRQRTAHLRSFRCRVFGLRRIRLLAQGTANRKDELGFPWIRLQAQESCRTASRTFQRPCGKQKSDWRRWLAMQSLFWWVTSVSN